MERREGNKHLSNEVRAKIIALKNFTSKTYEEIALKCDCHVSSLRFSNEHKLKHSMNFDFSIYWL